MSDYKFESISNIKRISINTYGDELLIDAANTKVFERFNDMYKNISAMVDKLDDEGKELEKEFPTIDNMDAVVMVSKFNTKYVDMLIEEIDKVFGEGTIHMALKESYELDSEFAPDIDCILAFIEQIIPIMEKIYGERIQRNRTKYNANRKGRRSK